MTFEEKKETERVLKEFVNTFADFKKLNKEQLDYMLLLFDKYDLKLLITALCVIIAIL